MFNGVLYIGAPLNVSTPSHAAPAKVHGARSAEPRDRIPEPRERALHATERLPAGGGPLDGI